MTPLWGFSSFPYRFSAESFPSATRFLAGLFRHLEPMKKPWLLAAASCIAAFATLAFVQSQEGETTPSVQTGTSVHPIAFPHNTHAGTQDGEFQIDWLPWRGHSWHVGLSLPLGQPWRGKTRPRNAHQPIDSTDPPVLLYTPDVPELEEAVANLTESALWINRLACSCTACTT